MALLSSRIILGGAVVAYTAHAWWTQPCKEEQKSVGCQAVLQWDRCKSCEERLYDIYRFEDMSYCRQCHEEIELEQETSDEEEGAFN